MLTLDELRRMAAEMPREPAPAGGQPPYRRPDDATRIRRITLPSVREEVRRATRLFAFFVGGTVGVFTLAGIVVTAVAALAEGAAPCLGTLSTSSLWYAGWTALAAAPFAAAGLAFEVERYRRVRRALGDTAWLDARGQLTSDDGRRCCRLDR
jgi:hypothetical protein